MTPAAGHWQSNEFPSHFKARKHSPSKTISMGKQAKSQWDFGEVFPAEQIERTSLSFTYLNWQIRRLLEQHFGQIWVVGEITNLRVQASGHIYFTLKDAN